MINYSTLCMGLGGVYAANDRENHKKKLRVLDLAMEYLRENHHKKKVDWKNKFAINSEAKESKIWAEVAIAKYPDSLAKQEKYLDHYYSIKMNIHPDFTLENYMQGMFITIIYFIPMLSFILVGFFDEPLMFVYAFFCLFYMRAAFSLKELQANKYAEMQCGEKTTSFNYKIKKAFCKSGMSIAWLNLGFWIFPIILFGFEKVDLAENLLLGYYSVYGQIVVIVVVAAIMLSYYYSKDAPDI